LVKTNFSFCDAVSSDGGFHKNERRPVRQAEVAIGLHVGDLNSSTGARSPLQGTFTLRRTLPPSPKWMCEEDEIDGAHKIVKAARRTR
jgi:hypothetical protein